MARAVVGTDVKTIRDLHLKLEHLRVFRGVRVPEWLETAVRELAAEDPAEEIADLEQQLEELGDELDLEQEEVRKLTSDLNKAAGAELALQRLVEQLRARIAELEPKP